MPVERGSRSKGSFCEAAEFEAWSAGGRPHAESKASISRTRKMRLVWDGIFAPIRISIAASLVGSELEWLGLPVLGFRRARQQRDFKLQTSLFLLIHRLIHHKFDVMAGT